MAQRGEMPAFLASVHYRFRTPHAAIVINSALVLALGLYSSFTQAATFAAIARLGIFASTCAALTIFRAPDREPAGFQVPAGRAVALGGIAFCAWLLRTRSFLQAWMLLAIMAAGTIFWLAGRKGWFTTPRGGTSNVG